MIFTAKSAKSAKELKIRFLDCVGFRIMLIPSIIR